MNIPVINRSRFFMFALIILTVALSTATTFAQKVENESTDIDQCRNGVLGTDPCSGNNWVNGNVGTQNSKYTEDEYLPYRIKFGGLQVGQTYQIVLGYDIKHSGAHAIDYLGSYDTKQITNRATGARTTRVSIPCDGVTDCLTWGTSTAPITEDPLFVVNQPNPNLGGFIYQPGDNNPALPNPPDQQYFTIWGATGLTFEYFGIDPANGTIADAQLARLVRLTFTAQEENPVLGWSGHVGWAGDWGNGQAAGGISGSPYHMRVIGLGLVNGTISGGNQDRSLSADAIDPSGTLFIRKEVFNPDTCNSWLGGFGFTASANFRGIANDAFLLYDLNKSLNPDGVTCNLLLPSPGDVTQSNTITSFTGGANVITVTEGAHPGWDLDDVVCSQGGVGTLNVVYETTGTAPNLVKTGKVTVTVDPYRVVTCTWQNQFSSSSAAPATVAGRVVNSAGRGISGISMVLTDLQTGESRIARTNTFGYYIIEGAQTEVLYSLTVSSKRYSFNEDTRYFTLNEDMFDMNFFATN